MKKTTAGTYCSTANRLIRCGGRAAAAAAAVAGAHDVDFPPPNVFGS